MNPAALAAFVRDAALRAGFSAAGITDLSPVRRDALDQWLAAGMNGEMQYMARQGPRRNEPQRVWPDGRSAVVVLDSYAQPQAVHHHEYRVATYAQGVDYHDVMKLKLESLGQAVVAAAGGGSYRTYSDAGPLPERELARRAGLGWIAKNTMLIHPTLGSFTFIGVLLTDLELQQDSPYEADRCGSCTRCLEACPTDAFPAPLALDARKCISYLTIEAAGPIPDTLAPLVGDNLFGCDICQDVCPWNIRFAEVTSEMRYRDSGARPWPALEEILKMEGSDFEERFGPSAVSRTGLSGLQRNARVVRRNLVSVRTEAPPE